jgi:hypothetical protein
MDGVGINNTGSFMVRLYRYGDERGNCVRIQRSKARQCALSMVVWNQVFQLTHG